MQTQSTVALCMCVYIYAEGKKARRNEWDEHFHIKVSAECYNDDSRRKTCFLYLWIEWKLKNQLLKSSLLCRAI